MIMVNNPGSWSHIYGPFRHTRWNRLTPTDPVFPFFLLIGGGSITLALLFYSLPIADAGLNEHYARLADHSLLSHKFLSLLYAIMFIPVNFIPAYWLYKRRIYIKL